MAISANVILNGSLTHTSKNGRKFERGKPQTLTNPSEIRYYQGLSGFSVTVTKIKNKKNNSRKQIEEEIEAEETKEIKNKKVYTEKKLKTKTKSQLKKIAKNIDALVTGDESVIELIELILETQKEEKENDEDLEE